MKLYGQDEGRERNIALNTSEGQQDFFALTAMWRLHRGRWAYLPELSKGSASCSLHDLTFKNIRIFA